MTIQDLLDESMQQHAVDAYMRVDPFKQIAWFSVQAYRIYIHTYIHTYTHAYLPTCLPTYLPTYLHTCIHTCLVLSTYTHSHVFTSCLHMCLRTCLNTCLRACPNTCTDPFKQIVYVRLMHISLVQPHAWKCLGTWRGLHSYGPGHGYGLCSSGRHDTPSCSGVAGDWRRGMLRPMPVHMPKNACMHVSPVDAARCDAPGKPELYRP